jgi:hypothetical protein
MIQPSSPRARGRTPLTSRVRRRPRESLAVAAGILVFAVASTVSTAPPPPATAAELLEVYIDENAQSLRVSARVAPAIVVRDSYSATEGIQSFAAGGTNHDWARLVLLLGEFPMTESNITVITRWMRQENGPDDWFNRNNPLNNGWGSGGGGGTGTYDDLLAAARNAAEALRSLPGYSGIVEALMASASTESVEQAIWASPWATGHYNNGAHWSSAPVPVVTAPAGTW